ncbi:porin [Cupriavidus taiwanensis]|uniref:porin n=1 Tax=Cupriavidus taiwanensis TaxID=164546 RepID=UPI001571863B|nr:porin [Cupriavidus taiwanensis]NSX15077.1 porin [Cupriavidus taiwanensis]
MQKTASHWLLAAGLLPVAAVTAALTAARAHAEPGITVYGIVSTAVRYTSNLDGHHHDQAALVSGGMVGSRFGLKGDEDLGGGQHAIFQLEAGIGSDDGRASYQALFGRQAYAGLAGDWGSLTFGRQYNALNNIGWAFNPLDQGWGNFWSDPLYLGGDIFFQDYRINHSVVYKKTAGPLTLQLDYGAGGQAGSLARGATLGGGLMLQQGALALGAAYDQRRSADGGGTVRNYAVGGSYASGKATFYLGHMGRRESARQQTADGARFDIAFAGLGYQLTPALHLSGAYYRYWQRGNVTTQFQQVPVLLGGGNADSVALVADYALSRRTSLYLEADVVRARGGAVGRETEYWAGTPAAGVARSTRVGAMLGMRHHF